jgi:cytochrome P450
VSARRGASLGRTRTKSNAAHDADYGFGARPSVFAPLLGNGIFTQEGAAWKHSRELLRKQFVRVKYQNLEHFREHVDNLVTCLPADGDIDLQPLFFRLPLKIATALLFGRSVYSLRANIDQAVENREFAESFNIAQEGLAKRFRLAPFHFVYNPPAFRKACRNVHQFVERYIQGKGLMHKGPAARDTEADAASWFIDQVAEESATEVELRDQLLNVLLAGRDTTACCLSWTLCVPVVPAFCFSQTNLFIVGFWFDTLTSWGVFAVKS